MPRPMFLPLLLPMALGQKSLRGTHIKVCCIWLLIGFLSRIMHWPMFLLLLLPMALGQISLRGTHIKVTTVTNRPFIMRVPNLIKGERWLKKSINNNGFVSDITKASWWICCTSSQLCLVSLLPSTRILRAGMWHMKLYDLCHMTCDIGHMTYDIWQMT